MTDQTQIVDVIRAAAAGRREYAATSDGEIKALLEHEAYAFDCVAYMIESGDRAGFVRSFTPSWRWKELGADIDSSTGDKETET